MAQRRPRTNDRGGFGGNRGKINESQHIAYNRIFLSFYSIGYRGGRSNFDNGGSRPGFGSGGNRWGNSSGRGFSDNRRGGGGFRG